MERKECVCSTRVAECIGIIRKQQEELQGMTLRLAMLCIVISILEKELDKYTGNASQIIEKAMCESSRRIKMKDI